MTHRVFVRSLIALPAVATWACSAGNDAARGDAKPNATGSARSASATTPPIQIAERPASACDWLPVAEVEAILGPLKTPPQGKEMSCRYDIPVDSATAQRRARYRAVVGPDAPGLKGVDDNQMSVFVFVDVRGDVTDERGGRIAGNMLSSP